MSYYIKTELHRGEGGGVIITATAHLCDPETGEPEQESIGHIEAIIANNVEELAAAADELDGGSHDTAQVIALNEDNLFTLLADELELYVSSHLLITTCKVDKEHRGNGVSKLLLTELLELACVGRPEMLITIFPMPIEDREGMTRIEGAAKLFNHWSSFGFSPLLDIGVPWDNHTEPFPLIFGHSACLWQHLDKYIP